MESLFVENSHPLSPPCCLKPGKTHTDQVSSPWETSKQPQPFAFPFPFVGWVKIMLINSKSQDPCCLVTKLHSGGAPGGKAGKVCSLVACACSSAPNRLLSALSKQLANVCSPGCLPTEPRHQLMHYLGEEATHPEPWPGQTASWGYRLVFRCLEPWVSLARETWSHNLVLPKSWVSLDIFFFLAHGRRR